VGEKYMLSTIDVPRGTSTINKNYFPGNNFCRKYIYIKRK
jgi:hypothetical protein